MAKIVGVDYGAKMSGNTVIAHFDSGKIKFLQVEKKKDTDKWLQKELNILAADIVYMDAPLSLPRAYYGAEDSYHYREADKITKAMSPMFLGGLTARAMTLRKELAPLPFHEIYPAYYQSEIIQSVYYKKEIDLFLSDLNKIEPYSLAEIPKNWHKVDALMALLIGRRHQENRHIEIGNPEEGIIII